MRRRTLTALALLALAGGASASITRYCTAAPNSTGSPATLYTSGTESCAANDLVLHARDLPPGVPVLFHYGPFQTLQPFGDGWRCVGGHIFRLEPPLFSDALGTATRAFDVLAPPADQGPGVVFPGATWNFQTYYRDVANQGAGFNLTSAVEVVFTP